MNINHFSKEQTDKVSKSIKVRTMEDREIYDELPDPRLMTEQERERYYKALKTFSQSLIDGSNGVIKGTVIIFGTAGDSVDNLKQMFYDPNTYKIIDYKQEETEVGFFKPSYMDTETRKGEYHSMISQGIEIKEDTITVNVPKGMSVMSVINNIIEGSTIDKNFISDGYHTFGELYEFRMMYNALLFNEWALELDRDVNGQIPLSLTGQPLPKYNVHKSWKHSDGELAFGGGWFIVSAMLPTGLISNHYKAEYWDLFKVPEVEKAIFEYDGHTSADVLERLKNL